MSNDDLCGGHCETDERCRFCGETIYRETDDMITCGGAFEVWYSLDRMGRRATCKSAFRGHKPVEAVAEHPKQCSPRCVYYHAGDSYAISHESGCPNKPAPEVQG